MDGCQDTFWSGSYTTIWSEGQPTLLAYQSAIHGLQRVEGGANCKISGGWVDFRRSDVFGASRPLEIIDRRWTLLVQRTTAPDQ